MSAVIRHISCAAIWRRVAEEQAIPTQIIAQNCYPDLASKMHRNENLAQIPAAQQQDLQG